MHKQKLKTLLSLTAILVAAVILYLRMFERAPKIEARPHLAIGEVLAEQAAKTVGNGGRITLIAPDTSVFEYPGAELQLKAFHRALQKANLHVAGTNLIKLDPNRLMHVRPGDLIEILRKLAEPDVVVSLLSPTLPMAEQKTRLPEKHARVIAVCSGETPRQVNLKALFDDHLLHIAIISRSHPSPAVPQSENLQEWFAHFFQLVTTTNTADLPAPGETVGR